MKLFHPAFVPVILLAAAGVASAIDRDASAIEWIAVDGSTHDTSDSLALSVWTEIGLATVHDEWAILAGGSVGKAYADDESTADIWSLGLGVKCYLADLTSLALIGTYANRSSPELNSAGATLVAKQRFLSADETLSPFAQLSATVQSMRLENMRDEDDEFTQVAVALVVGCDFALRDDMALVLQAGRSESEDLKGSFDDQADGWIASVAMLYYYK